MHDPSADIIPRDLRFELDRHADRAWMDGDVLHSIFIDCFAVMLPLGERFFIRSLRHYEQRIPDAFIRLGIQGYAAQEAFHTREHEAYNRGMRQLGYDPDGISERVRRVLPGSDKPFQSLLVTCAIEHLTYCMSCTILSNPRMMAKAKPAYRDLWTWHALEEIEHANVALAVLGEVGRDMPAWKRYLGRCMVMNLTLYKFSREALKNAQAMQRVAGIKPGLRSWSRLAWLAFGRPGWVWRYALPLLSYYMPGHGPRSRRDRAMIATGRAHVAKMLAARPAAG